MTASLSDLALYAAALLALFLTPGPVWLALSARALSGGFPAAWPLALGVVVGDALWPFLAILGVSWIAQEFAGFMTVLRFVGVAVFWIMGVNLIRHADRNLSADSRLTRPGLLAGFLAGLAVILGNPKAILFYMGILPGFFDLTRLSGADIAAIVGLSMAVPLIGNLVLAAFIDRIRRVLTSPKALRRTNLVAGGLMIAVGCLIPFT
ncbi:LysE family translocator [Fluviibacterium sp. DFM31]|uniref:LysE family translocator n=1 Tax=Meridianimarinicoccus marinus TaxID=3231483 RepID=A0ABV3L340_9RHOB